MDMISVDSIVTIGAAIIGGVSVFGNIYLYTQLESYKRIGGDFLKYWNLAKKNKKPLGLLCDKGSNLVPFVCDVSEKNDGILNGPTKKGKSKYTLLTPQAAQSSDLMKVQGGPDICAFQLPRHFPFNFKSSAAIIQLGQKVEEHPRLSRFRNTIKILELSFEKGGDFETDCRNYIRKAVAYNLQNGNVIDIPYAPKKDNRR
jgi:hypothetical protein